MSGHIARFCDSFDSEDEEQDKEVRKQQRQETRTHRDLPTTIDLEQHHNINHKENHRATR
jgi:hypothetical protein